MFLVDSSVWIEYFRPGGAATAKTRLKELLRMGNVLTCGVVQVEVLRGVKDEKNFEALSESFFSLPAVPLDGDVLALAARWGYELDRQGKVLPTTDLIIAAAASEKAVLLHMDADFKIIAGRFPLEEEMLQRR